VTGVLGDRLKVRIASPAAGGQANRAVIAIVERWLGGSVEITEGLSSPRKTLRVRNAARDAEEKLTAKS
jgi:uncharacterized protein (TIGR00251 family)